MRKILLSFAALVFFYGCATIQPRVDPLLGNWDYTIRQLPNGDEDGVLVLMNDGSGYVGVLEAQEGVLEISDLIIEDGEIVSGYFIGRGYHVEIRGVFEGDEFNGTVSAEGREFPMMAVKLEE